MAEVIKTFLDGMFSHEAVVFILSILPVSEIRGGMIAARLYDMNLLLAWLITYIGNMLPIPFLLLFLKRVFAWMRKIPFLAKIVDWLDRKAAKHKATLDKYAAFGLFVLVAIPLPGTGAWTGALVANFFDIRIKRSLPTIAAGVAAAGLIMTILLYAMPSLFGI